MMNNLYLLADIVKKTQKYFDLNQKNDELQSEDVVKEENNVEVDEQSENSVDGIDEKKAEDLKEEKTVVEFSEDQTESKTKKEKL